MIANAEHSEKLLTDLKRVVRDSEELLHDSGEVVGEKARELRERLNQTLVKAKEACTRLQEKTKATAKAADECIRDHPYQSIGVALGVGVLIGWLVTRKH
jgi:ElaB/YqjD/DUF883 family membrane-anchored ribosome-binding protein